MTASPVRPPTAARPPCLVFVLCFALACGPIVMIPGGALSGDPAPVPADWSFTDAVDTVQLETRPDDPYSVNIWCVATPRGLMVAGSRSSTWTRNAVDDPRVRLRVDGKLYDLRAVPADSEADVQAFLRAAEAKYDFELEPDQRETSLLFRLEPRRG